MIEVDKNHEGFVQLEIHVALGMGWAEIESAKAKARDTKFGERFGFIVDMRDLRKHR